MKGGANNFFVIGFAIIRRNHGRTCLESTRVQAEERAGSPGNDVALTKTRFRGTSDAEEDTVPASEEHWPIIAPSLLLSTPEAGERSGQ